MVDVSRTSRPKYRLSARDGCHGFESYAASYEVDWRTLELVVQMGEKPVTSIHDQGYTYEGDKRQTISLRKRIGLKRGKMYWKDEYEHLNQLAMLS